MNNRRANNLTSLSSEASNNQSITIMSSKAAQGSIPQSYKSKQSRKQKIILEKYVKKPDTSVREKSFDLSGVYSKYFY